MRSTSFSSAHPIFAMSLLPATLRESLQKIVELANQCGANIRVMMISTAEGVGLGRLYANDQPLNEEVLATIESVWAPASKQFPILGLKKVKQVTAMYDHGTLVHVYLDHMVSRFFRGRLRVSRATTKQMACSWESNFFAFFRLLRYCERSSPFSLELEEILLPYGVQLFPC
jgi:hypothetical protein